MKLWKRDTTNWTVRQVDGEPWPGSDSEGDKCYTNTHFENEADAWESLESEANAWVSIASRNLKRVREDVLLQERALAEAALALASVMKAKPSNTISTNTKK